MMEKLDPAPVRAIHEEQRTLSGKQSAQAPSSNKV